MPRRFIDTNIWNDPDVMDLDPPLKLMLIHLITHPDTTPAGVVRIHPKMTAFHVGVAFDEQAAEDLSAFVLYWPERRVVLIRRFVKWQCANPSFYDSAIKSLSGEDEEIQQAWYEQNADLVAKFSGHNHPTVVPPSPHRGTTVPPPSALQDSTVQDRTENTVSPLDSNLPLHRESPLFSVTASPTEPPVESPKPKKPVTYPEDFEQFWLAYKRPAGTKGAKPAALAEWRKLSAAYRELAIAELTKFQASRDWQKDNGQFIPYAERYLKRQLFLSPPDGNGNGHGRDSPNCPWCHGTMIKRNSKLDGTFEEVKCNHESHGRHI
jgi:hypothetical protein